MATAPPDVVQSYAGHADFFSGYRIDLEDYAALDAGSTDFIDIVSGRYNMPNSVDPRKWFQIRNQGGQGSCRGHSLAAVTEAVMLMAAGAIDLDGDGEDYERGRIDDRFSPQWCYIVTQQHDGIRGDRGSTMMGGVKTASQDGICPELVWPYPQPVYYETRIPEGARDAAIKYKLRRYKRFKEGEEEQIIEWIGSGQGFIDIGMQWPPRFNNNVIDRVAFLGRGGHATAGLGYIMEDGIVYYVGVNSHSERAQDKGYYYITRRGMRELLKHPSTVVIGFSDMEYPAVRPFRISRGLLA